MRLYCLATGSSGNCYILENEYGNRIMIECGIRVKDITSNPAFNSWRNIIACVISHGHDDHALSKTAIELNGVITYGYHNMRNGEVREFIGHNYHWKVKAFNTYHNFENSLGFLIKDYLSGKTLAFATDTAAMPLLLGVDYWLVECNYDRKTLDKAACADDADYQHIGNAFKNHMSLEYLKGYFRRKELKAPEAIILCHLSSYHADINRIRRWLKRRAPKTDIAKSGKGWTL